MALEAEAKLVELADGFMRSADVIHARLRKAIRDQQVDQATAQQLFQDEVLLRQRANGLYLDAANQVVTGLQQTQESLLGLVNAANDRIEKSGHIAQGFKLIADLLVLAAAAGAGKAGPILAAWQAMRKDVEDADEA